MSYLSRSSSVMIATWLVLFSKASSLSRSYTGFGSLIVIACVSTTVSRYHGCYDTATPQPKVTVR